MSGKEGISKDEKLRAWREREQEEREKREEKFEGWLAQGSLLIRPGVSVDIRPGVTVDLGYYDVEVSTYDEYQGTPWITKVEIEVAGRIVELLALTESKEVRDLIETRQILTIESWV